MRFNTRDKKVFVRCSVMLMVDKGYSYEVISDSMGISLKSVQRSVRRYEKQGVDGLLRFHYAGRQSRLTTEQEAVLQKELLEHLYTSTEQIQALIEEEWGIHYSRSGLRDLLHRLGLCIKRPKYYLERRMPRHNNNLLQILKKFWKVCRPMKQSIF